MFFEAWLCSVHYMHSFLALENTLKNSGSSNMDVELPPDVDGEMECFDTDVESEMEGFDISELPPLIPFNCVDDISEIELPPDVDGEHEENLNVCACKGITCFKKFGKQELMQMHQCELGLEAVSRTTSRTTPHPPTTTRDHPQPPTTTHNGN